MLAVGNGTSGYSGDGGPATAAQLNFTTGVAVDGSGNVYVADSGNNRVREITTGGVISTVAGNGIQGYAGDGGPAVNASLNQPYDVVVDGTGNIYIADSNNFRIRKVSTDGSISTISGDGTENSTGDGGPAVKAELYPLYLALDPGGNLYASDQATFRIRKNIDSGNDPALLWQATGPEATRATVGQLINAALLPGSIAIDGAGNLFVADLFDSRCPESLQWDDRDDSG